MTEREANPARDLCAFLDASPTPFHACAEVARRLEQAGFSRLSEADPWPRATGATRAYVVRGGSLAAWAWPEDAGPERGWRLAGAHTDSPNLRIRPRPDMTRSGLRLLGVEVYGGVLLNSWLDRDLALAGRAEVRGERGEIEERLFALRRPLLRVPQLAIHLNREVSSEGLRLNPQVHLTPLWSSERSDARSFRALLGEVLEVEPGRVLAYDAMLHDVQPAALVGAGDEFVSSARLDNLCSCFCALTGLLERIRREPLRWVAGLAFFDHEEVGSTSSRGAQGAFLRDLLERSVLARGGGREELARALSQSACLSADMAHATHPNYLEKHEPEHPVHMNAGPAIKTNVNLRYASEGESEALFVAACERAGVPHQRYAHRGDLACGTTIGPLTAASLGVRTVDVGNPQLAMHSARELCGARDVGMLAKAMAAFFE